MATKPFLTVDEVAARFGITPTTVYRLVKHGTLPAIKIGSQWRFSQEMLESWVTAQVHAKPPARRTPKNGHGSGGGHAR